MQPKKILLVALNAKYIHSNPAVYSLAAYANRGLTEAAEKGIIETSEKLISLIELTINDRYEDILSGILSKKAGIIGFSVYIWNADLMKRVMADIHAIAPEVILMAGGPEASNDPETYLQWCQGVFLGEGEQNMRRIAGWVAACEPIHWEEMEGVAFCGEADESGRCQSTEDTSGSIIIHQPGPTSVTSMDEIPFLYDELAPFENRIIYYESSRGCPFRCSYCLSSIDKRVRYRSMEIVLRELQFFLDKKVKQVKFIDRTFNSNWHRSLEIWQYLKDHDNGVTNFHFEIGADLLKEEEIALLQSLRPGLVQLEIGIQSTCEKTMDMIHRTTDNQKLFENVKALRKNYNINLHTDLIAGLPCEDYDRFRKPFDDIYPLDADQLQLGFLKVLKGTDMYDHREEYGLIYSSYQPYEVFATKWLTYEENMHLHKVCDAVELFYNSQMFRHSLKAMLPSFAGPFAMYEALAEYLANHHLAGIGLSTKKKFEIMEDFGREHNLPAEYFTYLAFDQMLHMHQSRRMSAEETFEFPDGTKTLRFDYTRMHPVTAEAYTEEIRKDEEEA